MYLEFMSLNKLCMTFSSCFEIMKINSSHLETRVLDDT